MANININIDLTKQTPAEDVGGGGGIGSLEENEDIAMTWWKASDGGWWLLGARSTELGDADIDRGNGEFHVTLGGMDRVPSS